MRPIEQKTIVVKAPHKGVIEMTRHDLLSGILYGIVLGLVFSANLSAHLPLLVILAVFVGAKMISLK